MGGQHDNTKGHQLVNITEATLPDIGHPEKIPDKKPKQKWIPDKIAVHNLKKWLPIDRPYDVIKIDKQIFKGEGVWHTGHVVAEYGNKQHGKQAWEYLTE